MENSPVGTSEHEDLIRVDATIECSCILHLAFFRLSHVLVIALAEAFFKIYFQEAGFDHPF